MNGTTIATQSSVITTLPARDSAEWTLQLWRSAERIVTSDPTPDRRRAYEVAIGESMAQLAPCATQQELTETYWSERLLFVTAGSSIRSDGRVLNSQVIAAAACWRRLAQLIGGAQA